MNFRSMPANNIMANSDRSIDFNTFLGKLAYEIIFNKFLEEDQRVMMRPRRVDPNSEDWGDLEGVH